MGFSGHFRRHVFDYFIGTAIAAIISYSALDSDYLAKKHYLDLNGDRIQDMVAVPRITGKIGETHFYLGQKDGTYRDLASLDEKELKGLRIKQEKEVAELEKQHKKQREAFKEKFRQYPK